MQSSDKKAQTRVLAQKNLPAAAKLRCSENLGLSLVMRAELNLPAARYTVRSSIEHNISHGGIGLLPTPSLKILVERERPVQNYTVGCLKQSYEFVRHLVQFL